MHTNVVSTGIYRNFIEQCLVCLQNLICREEASQLADAMDGCKIPCFGNGMPWCGHWILWMQWILTYLSYMTWNNTNQYKLFADFELVWNSFWRQRLWSVHSYIHKSKDHFPIHLSALSWRNFCPCSLQYQAWLPIFTQVFHIFGYHKARQVSNM